MSFSSVLQLECSSSIRPWVICAKYMSIQRRKMWAYSNIATKRERVLDLTKPKCRVPRMRVPWRKYRHKHSTSTIRRTNILSSIYSIFCMHLKRLLTTDLGKFFISVLLGLGLATLFRKVCTDKTCITFNGPVISDIDGKIYKHGDKCYKYSYSPATCDANKKIVDMSLRPEQMTV